MTDKDTDELAWVMYTTWCGGSPHATCMQWESLPEEERERWRNTAKSAVVCFSGRLVLPVRHG